MEYCYTDWDKVIQVIQEAVIPLVGLLIAGLALYYNRLKLKIRLFAVAEQTTGKDYEWSVSVTISNAGFTTFSIIEILDNTQKVVMLKDSNLPHKFDPGEIKDIIFPYEYSTKKSYVFALDHRGERHKIKIGKQPPLHIPDSFKQILTEPNFLTFGHFKRYIILKFKQAP